MKKKNWENLFVIKSYCTIKHECMNKYLPLHWTGTPLLQAWGSESARVRMNGIETGTFPVTIRHIQSMLSLIDDLSELQQSSVGEEPFPLLPVR